MTLQNFMAKINWRQILLHFVAFWFFIHAFETLSFLWYTDFVNSIRHLNRQDTIQLLTEKGTTASDLLDFQVWTSCSGIVGLLVAFVISLIISFRRKWFWVNALITFIVAYLLEWLDLSGWSYLKKYFWYLGKQFGNSTSEFVFNGTVLLIFGLLLFFLKRANQFIESNKQMSI